MTAGGFTLVELLVAMVLGLVLVLALSGIMIRHDGGKRTAISTNDLSIGSSYVSYTLDRELRSAGSGFTQNWRDTFGCLVHVARGGTQILPRTSAFPAPFAGVPQQVRLAPLLIHAGAGADGSDVLAVATGAAGVGETPIRVQPASATATDLRVTSTIGLRGNDLVLVAEDGVGCMVQQVAAPFTGGATQQLNFAGSTYAKAQIDSLQLLNFGTGGTAFLSLLGNTTGNRPMLRLFGIGANATLFSYDMLRLDGIDTLPQPLVEGVVELRALYGVDTTSTPDGTIDEWIAPTTPNYTAANLTDGSAAARDRLTRILAVRVGMVLRSDRIEREVVAPGTLKLFTDLDAGLHRTFTISTPNQRFRAVQFTVPLRNVMISARV
ncbi:MAG TPA: PilW family protein [Rubrivivax sp.]|nr:PilW family protein [Rubrivivax sp.]